MSCSLRTGEVSRVRGATMSGSLRTGEVSRVRVRVRVSHHEL